MRGGAPSRMSDMNGSKRRWPTDFGGATQAAHMRLPDDEADTGLFEAEPAPSAPLEPPPVFAPVAAGAPQVPVRRPEPPAETTVAEDPYEAPAGWPIYLTALAVSALWALAPISFAIGYRNHVAPLQNDAFALAVFALLAIGPAGFVWGAAYMIRQGQKLAYETRRAKAMAEEMLAPAMLAAARAGHVAQGVRDEIQRAGAAADRARETIFALQEALVIETEKLTSTAAKTMRTAQDLAGALGQERGEMEALSKTLDSRSAKVAEAITQQARMVAEAAELADTQMREADAALSARAADLAAAAGEASDTARTAGEDLIRHIARLETAGAGVAEQVKAVEAGLSEQRSALVAVASALRQDHDDFSRDAEAHAAILTEFISQSRLSATEMNDRAAKSGEDLKALMAEAVERFRDLAETARAEREEFGLSILHSLETVSQAAADQRRQLETQTRTAIEALGKAAEETREAAARHAETAREQVDQLSEAAFSAGQKANQVFEARLEEARALIDQSSRMVEEAGAITARKLDEGAGAARASLQELSAMLAEIERRSLQLPLAARAQAEEVRTAVLHGMQELMVAANRTAEEARAIDAAFQERVRRNFEMLGEAVRLMGATVTGPAPATAPTPPSATRPPPSLSIGAASARMSLTPSLAAEAATPSPSAAEEEDELALEDVLEPAARPVDGAKLAEQLGLRPRLKLTPTASDAEFSAVFESAGGAPAPQPAAPEASEEWTWKDLLASIDGPEAEGERLQDLLSRELRRMSVEPDKLLPKPRIDEIAAVVQTGDVEGARLVVKRLAPAATRRIARSLTGDETFKRRAVTFVRRYQTLLKDAAVRDPEGFVTASMLDQEGGRLYLLLDAAAEDLA